MKLALAQTNPLVGDIAGNSEKILDQIARARLGGARLVLFPELTIVGYPPKDLLLKEQFVDDNLRTLEEIASECVGITCVLGVVTRNESPAGRSLRNSAAVCSGGRVQSFHHKSLLPTYDVFDEHRYFEPSQGVSLVTVDNDQEHRLAITICEDLWNDESFTGRRLYTQDPIAAAAAQGATLFVNISASPFARGKHAFRQKLFCAQAKKHSIPLVFVNQVGGNDDLVFDGASMFIDADGQIRAQAKAFDEDLLIVDLRVRETTLANEYPGELSAVHQALVLGTRDYVNKCGFEKVLIGLSGGIDSAVTAAIAAEALGPSRVHGVAMPSRYSSDHSLTDAAGLAKNLGMSFEVISIRKMHEVTEAELVPHFEGRAPDVTEENIQARIRGNVLMSLSNKFGWLLLTTGNKSELAVGYCTMYGDMCGGLAVISDVPKTMVYELARLINAQAGQAVIPQNTIDKVPSAELKPDQSDQDSLPPYDLLDRILECYVEQEQSADDIIAQGFDEAVVRDVAGKVDRNEYKRRQAATGLKVTSKAFGTGRRMPIAAKHTL